MSNGSSSTLPSRAKSGACRCSASGSRRRAQFQGFYGFADGSGGFAIVEADSAATVARTTAPWTPWLRFTMTPIVPIEEATAIAGEAIAFRESVQ